uniref:NAD-dependent DNA ligase LigA n=1 Tax=Coprococcus catus TaxID=116085 RepID=UPI0022E96717|nr:NAD-dependent DNA ligase LigA [Coprococcus catus]
MDKLDTMKSLISKLNEAAYYYYQKDAPIVSDKRYDEWYDQLVQLEKETGIVLASSPTQTVQGFLLKDLKKVKHMRPMLSANKSKDVNDIKKFLSNKKGIVSWKMDGLTIVLTYKAGKFVQAVTRGTGEIGEDVTHTMRMCENIPLTIPYPIDMTVRGECVISWNEFTRINDKLIDKYKHPRNLAAGTVRQLDSNIVKDRKIMFKAFELVQDDNYNHPEVAEEIYDIGESFDFLSECGFDVVEHDIVTRDTVDTMIEKFDPDQYAYPVDGLIFTYDDYVYGKQLGTTSKFPLNMMALKWEDEVYETTLRDIEWNTTRSGAINPVAIFDEIDLDGALTTRATLHNVSIIKSLELGIGDTIQVYRSNKVIPKVHDNLTRSNTYIIPDKCPCCGSKAEVKQENDSQFLFCSNPECPAKFTSKLSNFVSRNGMNIVGLSAQTIEQLVDRNYVKNFIDVYHLSNYKRDLSALPKMGAKSVSKLLNAIEDSRKTDLTHLLTALSIPFIGKSTAKEISKYCHGSADEFMFIMNNTSLELAAIDGVGVTSTKALDDWWSENSDIFYQLIDELNIEDPQEAVSNNDGIDLTGKTFVITGSLNHFPNRDALKDKLESLGAKVSGSVSKNTFALICNDKDSNTGKSKKAKDIGVNVWSEDDLLEYIGE